MPTYEYECRVCGLRFERQQAISEAPIGVCPECQGEARRLISGGAGVIVKGSAPRSTGDGCSLERSGRTCCGRQERCDSPPCGGGE